jgi:hypothetical protein
MIYEIITIWVGIPLGLLLWKILLAERINIIVHENKKQ